MMGLTAMGLRMLGRVVIIVGGVLNALQIIPKCALILPVMKNISVMDEGECVDVPKVVGIHTPNPFAMKKFIYPTTNKPNSIFIDGCLVDRLWLAKTNAAYCKNNNEYLNEPNKHSCQKICQDDENCVGVSYTNNGQFSNICYVCLNETLESNAYGFNFYKKPGTI